MKRVDNIFDQICSLENLRIAEAITRDAKKKTHGVEAFKHNKEIIAFDRDPEGNLRRLHEQLMAGTFRTSQHRCFKVYEPKERIIYVLPYYPDGVLHQAIMNVLGPVFISKLEANTYSSIKERGGTKMRGAIIKALKDYEGTKYCLTCDIKKYFPSVGHKPLKDMLKRIIKDGRVLALLFEIVESIEGMPIGDKLSQPWANLLLAPMDRHFAHRYYFRYTDNVTLFSNSKEQLREDLRWINEYYATLDLTMKDDWQIFPTDSRGVNVAGFVFFHDHVALRKSLKKNIIKAKKKVDAGADRNKTLGGYCGWLYNTNSINFNNKYQILWNKLCLVR